MPPAGDTFTTVSGFSSRRVSSWYYGDGAQLINDAAADFGLGSRITPLDSVLDDPLAQRGGGWNAGVRIARNITPRFGIEFNLDILSNPLRIADGVSSALEATSNSFSNMFNEVFEPGFWPTPNVSSAVTTTEESSLQIGATGAVNINFPGDGAAVPYVTAGGGIVTTSGDAAATLRGSYLVRVFDMYPVEEIDSVALSHSASSSAPTLLFGGGVKWLRNARSGLRFDVRVLLSKLTVETLLSADPTVIESDTPFILPSFSEPAVQFSNDQSEAPSSLSGPTVNDFVAFTTSGWATKLVVTVGYFWGF